MIESSRKKLSFIVTFLALAVGLVLSILSELKVCTENCTENYKYHLFGLPFAQIGVLYFSLLLLSLIFSRKNRPLFFFTSLLLAVGIGSEFMFILIQKMSGIWCPLCLGIAATILLATLSMSYIYLLDIDHAIENRKQKEIMTSIKRSLVSIPAVLVGLLIAFFGVTKVDSNAFEINKLEEQMAFNEAKSPVEIYIFTSWTCPACRKLEPKLERMIPKMLKLAKVTFVDFGEDMTTLNYLPYNLSFMIHNKSSYINLRNLLKNIASDTGTPSEEEVEEAVKSLGLKYQQLNYSDIALAIEYYKDLVKKYKIQSIPAVVIDQKNGQPFNIFTGINITMENISKAIPLSKN